jgi:hypothetical protein
MTTPNTPLLVTIQALRRAGWRVDARTNATAYLSSPNNRHMVLASNERTVLPCDDAGKIIFPNVRPAFTVSATLAAV